MIRPRLKFALLLLVYTIAIALLEFTYKYLDFVTRGSHPPWQGPFIEEMTGAFAAAVVLPLAIWMAHRYRLDTWDATVLLHNLPLHLAALAVGSAVHTSLNWGLRVLIFPLAGLGSYNYGAMPIRYFMELPSDVLGYAITVGLTTLYYRQFRAAQLEKTLAQAQLQNLRLQLNPHFLFNTLNTISSVMYEDVRIADRMIARLSDLLRSTVDQGDAQEVTLERELEFLRLYVETMKARFEERLEVAVVATAETHGAMVPPLVLQPLVENSIKHGADGQTSKVRIEVRAARDNGSLRLEVRDHGPGISGTKDAALKSGIGLSTRRSGWSVSTEALTASTSGIATTAAWSSPCRFLFMSIRTLLVDDERPARRKMQRFLDATSDFEVIGEAADGAEAIAAIARLRPDVVFLDVQMPKLDGFAVAAALTPPLPEIVFVTAHDQFALKAFEVHALDYLLKPYDDQRFLKVLNRVRERRSAGVVEHLQRLIADLKKYADFADRILITENGRAFFLATADVAWIESARLVRKPKWRMRTRPEGSTWSRKRRMNSTASRDMVLVRE